MTLALTCCILMTSAAGYYIFSVPGDLRIGPEKNARASYLRERRDAVYENLRDLNFEYKAGKVPGTDYQLLKTSLQDEAASLLAAIASLETKAFETKATQRRAKS